MATGKVKWFNKGKGFIVGDDDNTEYFVHYSFIEGEGYKNLYEGDRVSFTPTQHSKGPRALNVRRLH